MADGRKIPRILLAILNGSNGWYFSEKEWNQNKNSVQSSEFKKLKITVNKRACVVGEYASMFSWAYFRRFSSFGLLFLFMFIS